MRWDFAHVAREQYGRSADFSPTLANTNAGGHPGAFIYEATCNCQFVPNYKYGIGPRIGLAYQINSKTVFRGGWGFVYAPPADIAISAANSFTNQPAGTNGFLNVQDPDRAAQAGMAEFQSVHLSADRQWRGHHQ